MDHRAIYEEFAAAVNMTAAELRDWLQSRESRTVGWKGRRGERGESVGHASGRHIANILEKDRAELTDSDYVHMRKTVGFIRRHLAQEPPNIVTSRWRFSLMNWGHDPLKRAQLKYLPMTEQSGRPSDDGALPMAIAKPKRSVSHRLSGETHYLRARAVVARSLAAHARDTEVAKLLFQISEEFEEQALLRESEVLNAVLDRKR